VTDPILQQEFFSTFYLEIAYKRQTLDYTKSFEAPVKTTIEFSSNIQLDANFFQGNILTLR
jgi:hypothetical protein